MRVFAAMVVVASALMAACGKDAPARQVAGGDAAQGRRLIEQYQCGACHTIEGVAGAASNAGPPLAGLARRSYIAGRLPNMPEHLVAWLVNPPAHKPGTMMPDLGVSQAEARHMAAYLYTLQ